MCACERENVCFLFSHHCQPFAHPRPLYRFHPRPVLASRPRPRGIARMRAGKTLPQPQTEALLLFLLLSLSFYRRLLCSEPMFRRKQEELASPQHNSSSQQPAASNHCSHSDRKVSALPRPASRPLGRRHPKSTPRPSVCGGRGVAPLLPGATPEQSKEAQPSVPFSTDNRHPDTDTRS